MMIAPDYQQLLAWRAIPAGWLVVEAAALYDPPAHNQYLVAD
jgi:hypothetical protein